MGISILPPDVNSSGISFSVDGPNIRFGLGAIKGMGEGAAGKIIESRKKEGKFKNFLDFCERCGSELNSRMIEHLTRAGALDSLGLKRSQVLAVADKMIAFAAERARDKAVGQGSLFDAFEDEFVINYIKAKSKIWKMRRPRWCTRWQNGKDSPWLNTRSSLATASIQT
jgi:DNA polymerase-3 subunit alpha